MAKLGTSKTSSQGDNFQTLFSDNEVIKLGNISYDQRVEIAELTREKHSEENYRKKWEQMFNVLLDENQNRNSSQGETVGDIMIFDKADYSIRGDNQITLSKELEAEIKSRFKKDRENRYQIFLLSSSLRRGQYKG